MSQEATVLKPCPWCGDATAFVERADYSSCYVHCNGCGAHGPIGEDATEDNSEEVPGYAQAGEFWNRRTEIAASAQQDEREADATAYTTAASRYCFDDSEAGAFELGWDAGISHARAAQQVQADAARYRWLRGQHWNESSIAVVCDPKKAVKLGGHCPYGEGLDEIIDAAMNRSGEQKA